VNDDRHGNGTPTSDPYRALELTQLIDDLSRTGLAVLHKRDGLAIVAEALYERGVRSRLFAPYRDTELVQFTWDPDVEGFEITETGVYELIMEAIDVPAIEPWPTFPRAEMPRMLHRLRRKAGLRPVLMQMSEVPGHVDAAPAPRRCPWCEWSFDALVDGRIPFHKRSFMTDWMECQGSRHLAEENGGVVIPARSVPGPIPERKLPEGVYNVIHFVQLLDLGAAGAGNPDWRTQISDGRGGHRQLTTADLHAVLAEIPDVAPRYPTIWAYEQACRTIRERDRRIEDALTVLEQRPPDPEDCIKVIRDAHETLKLRMPRTLPATPEQLTEVARALEACETDDDAELGGTWSTVARTLAAEVLHLRTLGDTLAGDITEAQGEISRLRRVVDQQGDLADTLFLDPDTGLLVQCGSCSALEPPVNKAAVGRSARGWPRCAQHLVEDALDDAGLEKDVQRCSSCSHLASAHYEDGSGCSVTIRDVGLGADNHCPCTFDARSVHRG